MLVQFFCYSYIYERKKKKATTDWILEMEVKIVQEIDRLGCWAHTHTHTHMPYIYFFEEPFFQHDVQFLFKVRVSYTNFPL